MTQASGEQIVQVHWAELPVLTVLEGAAALPPRPLSWPAQDEVGDWTGGLAGRPCERREFLASFCLEHSLLQQILPGVRHHNWPFGTFPYKQGFPGHG